MSLYVGEAHILKHALRLRTTRWSVLNGGGGAHVPDKDFADALSAAITMEREKVV